MKETESDQYQVFNLKNMGQKQMDLQRQKIISWFLSVLTAAVVLSIGIGGGWYWLFHMPYRICTDCRGQEINVETMKYWEEREENSFLDIVRIAGWRTERQQTVSSVSTARKQRTQVICVYGSMELADPAPILCGRYGLAIEGDYCVLSEDLARDLFGSIDVAGECVKMNQEKLIVAGVIEKEGNFLMRPAKEGKIEQLAVEFGSRIGAEEKIQRLMEE